MPGKDKTTTDPREPGRPVPEFISNPETEDRIEQAGEDSFPASDPPSFTPVTHPGQPKGKGKGHAKSQ